MKLALNLQFRRPKLPLNFRPLSRSKNVNTNQELDARYLACIFKELALRIQQVLTIVYFRAGKAYKRRPMQSNLLKKFIFFGGLGLSACSTTDPNLPELTQGFNPDQQSLIETGARVYRGTCVSCHAFDPREEGPVGPAVAGSPLKLLEARVLRAEYPSDYQPKRDTHKMMSMPQLKSQIPALYSYLEAYKNLPK